MKMSMRTILLFSLYVSSLFAQTNNITLVTGPPTSSVCISNNVGAEFIDITNGVIYQCVGVGTFAIFSGSFGFPGAGAQSPVEIIGVAGLNNQRVSIQPIPVNGGSAELQLVPGSGVNPASQVTTEILQFNVSGVNYERYVQGFQSNQIFIVSDAHDSGTPRDIVVGIGGMIYDDGRTTIPNQTSIQILHDNSVQLNGATYTTNFNSLVQNWGSLRTRLTDNANTGSSGLIIDTMTGGGSSTTADSSFVDFRRGNTSKWTVGLNVDGNNIDSYAWKMSGVGTKMMLNGANGNLQLTNLQNFTSGNNSLLALAATGATLSRNIADAGVTLNLTQTNASSTGDILRINNSAGDVFQVQQSGIVGQLAGSALTVNSNAIAPVKNIHHVGAGLIKTITVPSGLIAGTCINLIPDSAFTYDATGNLVVPSGGGTAVINKLMTVCWDGTKWTPNY